MNKLIFKIYFFKKAIKKSKNNNIVIFPMSLSLPFDLLSKGAKEKTLNEFLKALNNASNKNLYLEI